MYRLPGEGYISRHIMEAGSCLGRMPGVKVGGERTTDNPDGAA